MAGGFNLLISLNRFSILVPLIGIRLLIEEIKLDYNELKRNCKYIDASS